VKQIMTRFWRNESGATAIEYGLIVGIIGVGIIATVQLIPEALDSTFTSVIEGFRD
jgi:pilus assembly protein Flp/PilA